MKRYTIELDEEFLEEAKRALGQSSIRAAVEEALRTIVRHAPLRSANLDEAEFEERRARQHDYFKDLDKHLDLDVLKSNEMWLKGAEGRQACMARDQSS
jgi:Arc/MetJ family transcription regulator